QPLAPQKVPRAVLDPRRVEHALAREHHQSRQVLALDESMEIARRAQNASVVKLHLGAIVSTGTRRMCSVGHTLSALIMPLPSRRGPPRPDRARPLACIPPIRPGPAGRPFEPHAPL